MVGAQAIDGESEDAGVGAIDVRELLDLRTWQAFDIDNEGRVLAGHDDSGSVQLVEIAVDGSVLVLTNLAGSCSGRYVRGQRRVVVEHDLGGNENAQLSLIDLDPPGEPLTDDELEPLAHDLDHIHSLVDVQDGYVVFSTNRRNGVDFDVVAIDLASRAQSVLYDDGGYAVATQVSPNGREVAITSLSPLPCSTQVVVTRTDDTRFVITGPDEHALHADVHWLADGTGLVMTSNRDREFCNIVRVSPDGTWTWIVEDEHHDLSVWPSPDGVALLVGRNVDGATQLSIHDHNGHHVRDVALPYEGVVTAHWSANSTRAVLSLNSPTTPGEILELDPATGELAVAASSEAVAPHGLRARLVEPTLHQAPTPDGELIPCFVYRAAERDPALDGAVVIHIHGGPEAQAQRIFNPVVQALASAGITVLVPNVRGSTGYGKRWYSLDDGRLRIDSIADLLALRSWVSSIGGDPERIALYGASYGGYMVLSGLAMQSGAWRAGVDIVGMSSLVTFLENTSPYRRAAREREYGSLERDRNFLEAASPITYLDKIEAPLFIIHGTNDPRVPLSESEQIKAALDVKGVPAELMVFADEGHGLSKRANRVAAYPEAIAFLRKHLSLDG